jgi:hypothetical protein
MPYAIGLVCGCCGQLIIGQGQHSNSRVQFAYIHVPLVGSPAAVDACGVAVYKGVTGGSRGVPSGGWYAALDVWWSAAGTCS